jgi:polyvinyl alcohol dehydrogenase (cytochrome)
MTAPRSAVLLAVLCAVAAASPSLAVTRSASSPAACAAAPAAGGDWPSYGHDPHNTRTQPAEHTIGAANVGQLAAAWTFDTARATGGADQGVFNGTPIESAGCLFAASTGGFVYALNANTGKVTWHRQFTVPTAGAGGVFVGGPALDNGRVIVLVNKDSGPYLVALDQHTGHTLWQSASIFSYPGGYTNATPQVFDGVVIAGFSPPEGDPRGVGGVALLDAATGQILTVTPTIPASDVRKGYAGGGIWSTPAFDPATGYAYVGAGNPFSRTVEHRNVNAILKIDLDRSRTTFGRIVSSYKGNADQYAQALEALSHTPACAAGSDQTLPLDDPACGQLDLDFGASPNLFTSRSGHLLVGDLQKSGVYHVAYATTMQPAWTKVVGLSCQLCNAAATATDGTGVYVEGTPGGAMWSLSHGGARQWASPVGDGAHYQAISTANGVVYTVDSYGMLDAWNARTAAPLLHRPLALATKNVNAALTSAGIVIANHTVYVSGAKGGAGGAAAIGTSAPAGTASGVIVGYRLR